MTRKARRWPRCVEATLLLAACHAPAAETSSTGTTQSDEGTTTQASTTGGSAGTGGASTGSGSSSSGDATTSASTTAAATSSGEATSDASTTEDASSSGTTGVETKSCKKLDLLFLIIDGGDLWDTRYALHKLMPHVAQRLEVEFADWDYHVMVANPDGKWGNASCDMRCGGNDPCDWKTPYPCEYEPGACDLTRGAGITFPAGSAASNVACPIDGGRRYIVRGQQDLEGTLSCAGRVGGGYDGSKTFAVARTTLDVLTDTLNGPGACNEGFFREDAYLILFVLSPYPDYLSEGTPEAWTTELKAHKGGKFDKIYFVGLFDGCDSGFGWKEYEPLNEWVESLYYHEVDDACASTLIPYMDPALDYVLSDCQE